MEVDFDFILHPAHVHWLVYLHEYFYLLTAILFTQGLKNTCGWKEIQSR